MCSPYHTIPYHTIPYHTTSHHTILYYTVPYHTVPYRASSYRTIPYTESDQSKTRTRQNIFSSHHRDSISFSLVIMYDKMIHNVCDIHCNYLLGSFTAPKISSARAKFFTQTIETTYINCWHGICLGNSCNFPEPSLWFMLFTTRSAAVDMDNLI